MQTHLQLGKITVSHARELLKLPCGTQNDFLRLLIGQNLTSRQTTYLVAKYSQSKTKEEQKYVLEYPLKAIEEQIHEPQINDCRLGSHGNRLLKTVRILARQQYIFIGQSTQPPLNELTDIELEILTVGFTDVLRKIKIIQSILKPYNPHEK